MDKPTVIGGCIGGALIVTVLAVIVIDWCNPLYAAQGLSQNSQYKEANDLLEKAIKDNNLLAVYDPRVYLEKGFARTRCDDYAGAQADLDKAEALYKKNAAYWGFVSGCNHNKGRFLLTDIYLERGWAKYKARDFQGAINDYNRALKVENDKHIIFDRSLAYAKAGRKLEARKDLDTVISADPSYEEAWHQRATLLVEEGKSDEALKDLTKAISINQCASAYIDRGLIYKSRGQVDNALSEINAAIRIDPKSEKGYHERARLRIDKGEFRAAVADLELALKYDPKCFSAARELTAAKESTKIEIHEEEQQALSRAKAREQAKKEYPAEKPR